MDIRCQKCGTEYEFDGARVRPQGVTVKCTNCGYVFRVQPADGVAEASDAEEWLVRSSNDKLIAFRELTTLQKWIVEGRIDRDNEISMDGESWKQLGNIKELEPFFNVFDRARALNDLMSTGAIGDRPILVNGSEVLATMNPLGSSPSKPAVFDGPVPNSLADEAPTQPLQKLTAAELSTLPELDDRPPRAPVGFDNSKVPTRSDRSSVSSSRPKSRRGSRPNGRAESDNGTAQKGADLVSALARESSDTSSSVTEFLGPGSMPIAPSASLPPERSRSANDRPSADANEIVQRFERRQSTQRRIYLGAIVVGGLVGAAAFGFFGPESNPLRRMFASIAQPGVPAATAPDPIQAQVNAAYRALELDSISSLEKADDGFAAVLKLRPTDPALLADRALVLTTLADALRRHALEQETEIRAASAAEAKYAADKLAYDALSRRQRSAAKAPNAPPQVDVVALQTSLQGKRARASALVKAAFDLAREATTRGPNALAPTRALADYYRVQRDAKMKDHLVRAHALARESGHSDAATIYIEAAAMVGDPDTAPAAARENASHLLEEALTKRPTLLRARVLLARILIDRGLQDLAREALQRVVKESPDHDEAKRLLARIDRAGTSVAQAPAVARSGAAATSVKPTGSKPAPAEPPPQALVAAPTRAPTAATAAPKTPPTATPKTPPTAAPKTPPTAAAPKTTPATAPKTSPTTTPEPQKRGFAYWMGRGKSLREQGESSKALQAYERASGMKTRQAARAHVGMGRAYLDLGKAVAAYHQFRRAAHMKPGHAEAYLGQGDALRQQGKTDEALEAYRQVENLGASGRVSRKARKAIESIERAQ